MRFANLLALFSCFMSPVPGYSQVGSKPEKSGIVVAYPAPSAAFTPIFLSYEAGLFKKYGLSSRIQYLNPQQSAQAVISGDADFYAPGPDLLAARLKGGRLKFFASFLHRYVFQIWAAKEIRRLEDLRGKSVAITTPGSVLDIATREVLKRSGLVPGRDVKFLYTSGLPASLTLLTSGQTSAGAFSAPTTVKAREAGLNLLADVARLDIPGLQGTYGTTENYLQNNKNTVYAFLKAIGEGVVLSRKDPGSAKRAISFYTKTDDSKMVDEAYDAYAPYWANSLAVPAESIRVNLGYLDEKDFPKAKDSDPREFFDNSFVNEIERSGFFKQIGLEK